MFKRSLLHPKTAEIAFLATESYNPDMDKEHAPTNSTQLRLLRLALGFAAFAWGVSIAGVFLSWSTAAQALQGMGAQPIPYDRMLDYWLRMAAGAFALIGCWYLVLMLNPQKYYAAIPWFGGLMLVEGVVLLVHGLRLSLPPFPFYGDTSACLLGGGAILYLSRHAKPEPEKMP